MTLDRRRKGLWGLLMGASLISTYSLWPARTPNRAAVAPAAVAGAQAPRPGAPPAGAIVPAVMPVPRLAQAELSAWRSQYGLTDRDPFFTRAEIEASHAIDTPMPVAPLPESRPPYAVKLVLVVGSERRALIGDEMLKVGDQLGDERVVQILSDVIVLERGGERRELPVAAAIPVQIRTERVR